MASQDANIRERFLATLSAEAPDLDPKQVDPLISPKLVSPYILKLPKQILNEAQAIVAGVFELRKSSSYQERLRTEAQSLGLIDPHHYSIAMSYDFHVDETGHLRLIEINTNASFLALSSILYQTHNIAPPVHDFTLDEIRRDILNEMKLFGRALSNPRTAIVDDKPEQQKLFIEFLLYQSLFKKWGWSCEIRDVPQVPDDCDFIYNRSTDFFLQAETSRRLRDLYVSHKACLSPNPYEYLCLADKKRLVELAQNSDLANVIKGAFLQSIELTTANRDELWEQRKKYFFKPLRAFGAKQSYRGASISHRTFDDLVGKGILAQEYCPPREIQVDGQDFKYDLRFYAYMGRVQTAVARLYQGQVTNLKTLGGGFAAIQFD